MCCPQSQARRKKQRRLDTPPHPIEGIPLRALEEKNDKGEIRTRAPLLRPGMLIEPIQVGLNLAPWTARPPCRDVDVAACSGFKTAGGWFAVELRDRDPGAIICGFAQTMSAGLHCYLDCGHPAVTSWTGVGDSSPDESRSIPCRHSPHGLHLRRHISDSVTKSHFPELRRAKYVPGIDSVERD